MSSASTLPKMALGFVVRRCALAIGHEPTPEEFADWANGERSNGREATVFGRSITVTEAQVILAHRGRPVSSRTALPHEAVCDPSGPLPPNVVRLSSARRARDRR